MEEIGCKKCGKTISSKFSYCPYCGEHLSKEKQDQANYISLCGHCGKGLIMAWATCPYCNGMLDPISYEKYKHMESKNPEAIEARRKGNEYLELRDVANAIKCYEKAVALDLNYALAWAYLGLSLSTLEKDTEALPCFDKAIELNPKDSRAWTNKGDSLFRLEGTQRHCHVLIRLSSRIQIMYLHGITKEIHSLS